MDENDVLALSQAVAQILSDADADIAGRGAVCRASGKCCRFEAYGHRLYVTAAEMVHFASGRALAEGREAPPGVGVVVSLPQFFGQEHPVGCPYQVEGLCTARERRPLGCRVYFCDENAQGWQNELYERYHARLRAVHEAFGLPYRYVEWRAALRELMGGGGTFDGACTTK